MSKAKDKLKKIDESITVYRTCPVCFRCFYGINVKHPIKCGECEEDSHEQNKI